MNDSRLKLRDNNYEKRKDIYAYRDAANSALFPLKNALCCFHVTCRSSNPHIH